MKKIFLLFIHAVILLLSAALPAQALELAPYKVGGVWVLDGENAVLCLELEPGQGIYTYAPKQDGVYPTEIRMETGISGQSALEDIPVLFPKGEQKEDSLTGQRVLVFSGKTRVYALFPRIVSEGTLEISLLACSKERCQPFSVRKNFADFGAIDIETFQNKNELQNFLYAQKQNHLPPEQIDFVRTMQTRQNLTAGVSTAREQKTAVLGDGSEAMTSLSDTDSGVFSGTVSPEAFSLEALQKKAGLSAAGQDGGSVSDRQEYVFSVQPFYQGLEVESMAKALLFGLLAGFILNFMPCVLPVVALKLRVFMGGAVSEESKKQFREHMVFFALGILAWFAVLAVLLGILGFTWGQLFQEYWLMLGLCAVVFSLSLSLFGVFHLPIFSFGAGVRKNPKAEAFFSGFLATLLATPCSGPLLGGVLGFALTQPFYAVLGIFLCMGFGMALPYAVFACRPDMVRFMPRAGNWLLVMEKALAFFLLGTALYLFSLLPSYLHIKTLVLLLVLALCLFVWGKWAGPYLGGKKKFLAGSGLAACCAFVFAVLFIVPLHSEDRQYWQAFQKQEFFAQLGQKTVVLKFTADWCPTCKVLEQTVFTQSNMEALAEDDVVFMLADMTRFDEDRQKLLTALESASIPLLAVFPESSPDSPYIVRDVYTFETVKKVLDKARRKS